MNLWVIFITALIVSTAISAVIAWAVYKAIDIVANRKREEDRQWKNKQ
ncbi:MAG: hypothetical protein ACLRQ0_10155 [Monoglobales bacterium]